MSSPLRPCSLCRLLIETVLALPIAHRITTSSGDFEATINQRRTLEMIASMVGDGSVTLSVSEWAKLRGIGRKGLRYQVMRMHWKRLGYKNNWKVVRVRFSARHNSLTTVGCVH